ncbi:hypothetical protein BPOR_0157g00140 [Botrytis porri]|uniref:Uncharacterized protein n=1 Tax=Botrytis porri TaxID=87229 RepID=A0A4Z1KVG3_9HELO|nr:hypothetical protein BPOR_0157g00140 [Botrytis porri]
MEVLRHASRATGRSAIISGADVNALTYVLERFQSLRRITITPAAHASLDQPLYETPMIKCFPKGFSYPIPRGWPSSGPFGLLNLASME